MGDQAARQAAKGKGKDVETNREGNRQQTEAGTSLPRIIAQSAAALPSLLLSGPPGAGLGGNEKGESSRAGEALARAGESSVQLRSNSIASAGETMRLGQTQEHIAQEEASFAAFLDSDSVPMLSEPEEGLEMSWQSATALAGTAPPTARAAEAPSPSVAEQQARDGADAVALLAADGDLDHIFDADEPAAPGDLWEPCTALIGDGAGRNTAVRAAWGKKFDFIPRYLQKLAEEEDHLYRLHMAMHQGTIDRDEAWQHYFNQWYPVLENYLDEIWGTVAELERDFRPINGRSEGKPVEKPPELAALLRLRAILGHLRGTEVEAK